MSPFGFKNLPPLHALAAFEAVARLQSFARAADELCVTHGAVSHRIKLLEEHFGMRFLVRRSDTVTLTTKGAYFLGAVLEALSKLQEASMRLADTRRVVTVNAGPSSARNWLVPRLGEFYREHLDIDLEISATKLTKQKTRICLEAGEVDVAIRYGRKEEWSGFKCVKLLDVTLFPVCSPGYREALGGLRDVHNIRKAVLMRLPNEPWKPWFQAAGLDWHDPVSGPLFGDASLMLDAAANGQGIALARSVLVDRDLAARRLVRLFNISIPSTCAYYAVRSLCVAERTEINSFVRWLIACSRRAYSGPR